MSAFPSIDEQINQLLSQNAPQLDQLYDHLAKDYRNNNDDDNSDNNSVSSTNSVPEPAPLNGTPPSPSVEFSSEDLDLLCAALDTDILSSSPLPSLSCEGVISMASETGLTEPPINNNDQGWEGVFDGHDGDVSPDDLHEDEDPFQDDDSQDDDDDDQLDPDLSDPESPPQITKLTSPSPPPHAHTHSHAPPPPPVRVIPIAVPANYESIFCSPTTVYSMSHHPSLPYLLLTTGAGTLVVVEGNKVLAKMTLPVSKMGEDKESGWECLRGSWFAHVLDDKPLHYIAAGTSSGLAAVYEFSPDDHSLTLLATCDATIDDEGGDSEVKDELSPQIYACQMLSPTELMTASDDTITLWTINPGESEIGTRRVQYAFDGIGSDSIGGGRNPHDLVYVFDAAYNPALNLIAVGLSDGTTRLIDRNTGDCKAIVSIPLDKCYVTSVMFTSANTYCCTYNTGHIVIYSINEDTASGVVSILGDEEQQNTVFGAVAAPGALVTYSNDGTVRVYRVQEGNQGVVPPSCRIAAGNGEVYAAAAKMNEEGELVVFAGGNLEGEKSFMGESVRVWRLKLL